MSDPSPRNRGLLLTGAALAMMAVGGAVYWWMSRGPAPGGGGAASLPGPGNATYEEVVSAFFAGVAALDVDAGERAKTLFSQAIELVPDEPASWANRGLYAIRLNDYEGAARDLDEAAKRAPTNGAIEQLRGLLEDRRGRFAEAAAHLRRAIELDPDDLKARYALTQVIGRQGGADGEVEILRLLGEILERRPENLPALIDRARLTAKRGDAASFRDAVARLSKLSAAWPANAQAMLRQIESAAEVNPRTATRVAFLLNLLLRVPAYARGLDALEPPRGTVGEPIRRFLALEQPAPMPAPADEALTYAIEPLDSAEAPPGAAVAAAALSGAPPTIVLAADGRALRSIGAANLSLPFPGGASNTPPTPNGILAADLDSDYRMDLILAGAGGIRLLHQKEDGSFDDVTQATGLAAAALGASAFGVWAADIEMDGDLDLVVGLLDGETQVLRNNGDKTFTAIRPFPESKNLRDFAWADLDGDGDPDAALLDAGGAPRIMTNERAGAFRPRTVPDTLNNGVAAIAIADVDADGTLDLVTLKSDGELARLSDKDDGAAWETARIGAQPLDAGGDTARLLVADLDNNGGPDLIAAGRQGGWIWLGDGPKGFRPLALPAGLRVFAAADLTDDGRLDLIGLANDGKPVRGVGRGAKDYRRQVLRPRAAKVVGDGRINSFGVGGEIELRAGLLVQKQVIAGPVVHFGMGQHAAADVARILWPNGTVQAEFATKAGQVVVAEQRLKGSCPFLYARGANGMSFVTDFLWRSPLGLRINAQDTAGVGQTEDWVKIRGDQLIERDGFYDLSITAELWETHFFDRMELMAVDHPDDTEVFVDERFARQPPPLAIHATGPLRPIHRARDDAGCDVTDRVRSRDGRYLDTFELTFHQGIAKDHWVEVELEAESRRDRPLWLVANGWVHPTDSSINVAHGQGRLDPPRGLALEVATAEGGWAVAQPDLGFPAGKNKTILVRLDDALRPDAPRRFRLRTNLEVYWDELAVADDAADASVETLRLAPISADLRPRGYSRMTQADAGSPELPEYGVITGTSQRWLDLIGFYTRFGDVRELLKATDDRYVIANAGDEVALRFAAPPQPPKGRRRDFVMIGDGWNKDGDYNTGFSKTVLPLPSHDRPDYAAPPGELEDDPVYRRYPEDWKMYHTRYVTPRAFRGALQPRRAGVPSGPEESVR